MSSYVNMTKEEKIKIMSDTLKELNSDFDLLMSEDDIIAFLDEKVQFLFI